MKFISLSLLLLFSACSTTYYRDQTIEKLDVNRFMGKWYVIAHIPTFIEDEAYNAVETYTRMKDGAIDVDYRFRDESFNGNEKVYNQFAWIYDEQTKAHWKVRPFWPLKFDYLVHYLSDDYGVTVIGVPDRDYVWIMAREKTISEDERYMIDEMLEELGYDLSKMREVPQK